MTDVLQDAKPIGAGGVCPMMGNGEAIFSHPDRTDTVDRLDDPLTAIATTFHTLGPVIKGRGVGTPRGSQVQFADVILPSIFLTAEACEDDVYAAVTWDAVRTLYTRPKTFSSRCFVESLGRQGPTLTTLDPPEHSKYRKVAQPAFLPAPLNRYEAELIRPIMARRFAALRTRGQADLVRDLTPDMTFEINGAIIGFDASEVAFVAACKKAAFSHDPDAVVRASEAQNRFTMALIERRRVDPRDDLISFLVRQEVDGAPISDRNLLGLVNVIMAGGIDTIHKQAGNIVTLLLERPDQFALLRADPSLIPRFVEESVRYEGVATHFPRVTTEDTVLEGVAIPKGSIVFGMIFAADRDPSRWDNPHVLDVTRAPQPNLAFSAGPHACIGAQVARTALACFVEHLIDDLPNLRWDPAKPRPTISGWTQRATLNLPVLWDASDVTGK